MIFRADLWVGIRIVARAGFGAVAFWLVAAFLITVFAASLFSPRQPATVALDVGISYVRLVLPVFCVLLIQELLTREFDRKLYLTTLTYPRSYTAWLYSRVLVIAVVVLVLLSIMWLLLAGLVAYVGTTYAQATPVSLGFPYWVTLFFVTLDLLVGLSIGTLIAVSTTTPLFVLVGTLGLLIIARSYTPILQILDGADYLVDKFADPALYRGSLNAINYLLPDLGLMDVRMIALYGKWEFLPKQWGLLAFTCLAFSLALLSFAAWRLRSRKFS